MATKSIFEDVAPWPEGKDPNPRAVIGGNEPPIEERIPAEFREALLSERPDYFKKLEDLLGKAGTDSEEPTSGAVDRAQCTDEDTLAKCGILVKTLRACTQLAEKVHTDVKAPYLAAGRLVDTERRIIVDQLKAAQVKVEKLQRDYFDEQEAKAKVARDAAEADRAKLEALARENNLEDALPPPPPPARASIPVSGSPLRTDGATISAGKEWMSEVEDYVKAFKHVKDDAKVRAAVDAAILSKVRATKGNANKPLAGVRMWEATKVSNR